MVQRNSIHDKFRGEYSMQIAVLCDIGREHISVLFFDMAMETWRAVARSTEIGLKTEQGSICAELSRAIFTSMRQHNIPAAAVRKVVCAAPMELSFALEEGLSAADMFLRPETDISVVPFISAHCDGRLAAELAGPPLGILDMREGTMQVYLGRTISLAYYDGNKLITAGIPLSGAFDGSGIESGMPWVRGSIDEVSRMEDGTLCYKVYDDGDSMGIAPSAVLDAVSVMVAEGIIDSDGIMTDRDLFYIGEDFYISQSDVRVVQSDKAKARAALECFVKHIGEVKRCFYTGEVAARNGLSRMSELGIIPEEIAHGGSASITMEGMIRLLSVEEQERLSALIMGCEDITEQLYEELDEIYIRNLAF